MFTWFADVLSSSDIALLRHLARSGTHEASSATIASGPEDAKRCLTVATASPGGIEAAQLVDDRLRSHPGFVGACLPRACTSPRLVTYGEGMYYRQHVDTPTMTTAAIRTDLAATIFVSSRSEYEGGALRVHLGDEQVELKGRSGSMVVYPADLVHEVTEVASGTRTVVLVWVESLIADARVRSLLADLRLAESLAAQGDPKAQLVIRSTYGTLHRLGHMQPGAS